MPDLGRQQVAPGVPERDTMAIENLAELYDEPSVLVGMGNEDFSGRRRGLRRPDE